MSGEVIGRALQKGRVITEPAKAVVAVVAKQSPDVAASMAVINGKGVQLSTPHHRFWTAAYSAYASLKIEKFLVGLRSNTLGAQHVALPHVVGPFFIRKAVTPFAPVFRSSVFKLLGWHAARIHYEILYTIIVWIVCSWTEIPRKRDAIVIGPHSMMQRNPLAMPGADVPAHNRRLGADRMPIASDLAWFCSSFVGRFFPSQRQGMAGIVAVEPANYFGINLRHSRYVVACGGGDK